MTIATANSVGVELTDLVSLLEDTLKQEVRYFAENTWNLVTREEVAEAVEDRDSELGGTTLGYALRLYSQANNTSLLEEVETWLGDYTYPASATDSEEE